MQRLMTGAGSADLPQHPKLFAITTNITFVTCSGYCLKVRHLVPADFQILSIVNEKR